MKDKLYSFFSIFYSYILSLLNKAKNWLNGGKKYHRKTILGILFLLSIIYYFCLPSPLFNVPYSLIVNAKDTRLLGARIAKDGQWRFPEKGTIAPKFKDCITIFEDKRFFKHFGLDFLALGRAAKLNVSKGKILSGASTLTMQTIRLARKNQSRSFFEKFIEIVLATRLEFKYSKNEILRLYAAHAPFGGNVVGIEAAAWKYFGKPVEQLTWAEMSVIAVLPNSPSLIHLGKNRQKLLKKRNFLLLKLKDSGKISQEEYELSLLEPLPEKPKNLPNITPHLMDYLSIQNKNQRLIKQIQTTIDYDLQNHLNNEINLYGSQIVRNGVCNAAAIILDINTNEIVAYSGNTAKIPGSRDNDVNMIHAQRSTGSILKPFLYAFSLDDAEILPESYLSDIPANYSGFSPKNSERSYEGVVRASTALSRSLNVPMVRLLYDYGQPKFHSQLQQIGMKSLTKTAKHYGLSLILGGAETNLWEISGMYSGLVRSVKDYNQHRFYRNRTYEEPKVIVDSLSGYHFINKNSPISASSAYFTLEAMKDVKRTGVESAWEYFASSRKIAWKTGTSFGNRDAWAIGCTKDYVVAVWVGNADGEGRPEMTGTFTASPLLFHIFNFLPSSTTWFEKPVRDMEKNDVCMESGYLAGQYCSKISPILLGKSAKKGKVCSFCRIIHLDDEGFQVNANCYSPLEMINKYIFTLPPTEEHYFSLTHPTYKKLPTWKLECENGQNSSAMELEYPKLNSKIYIPITLSGEKGKTLFVLNHRNPKTLVYWHLDQEFIGTTSFIHEMAMNPIPGQHTLVLVDELGERIERKFSIEK